MTARACVFCGSRVPADPALEAAARLLGERLAARGIGLVYGGGGVGLMGVVADTVLAAGGEVVGVIPEFLEEWEDVHTGVGEMLVVDSLARRKEEMIGLSDAFVGLAGGVGTLDEICEVLSWQQLGLLSKPLGLLDTSGFFAGLREQLRTATELGLASEPTPERLVVDTDPDALLDALGLAGR
ncbi:MAG: TIGR00730 family Rossman fold protein [Solirubrobacterales bacterium]